MPIPTFRPAGPPTPAEAAALAAILARHPHAVLFRADAPVYGFPAGTLFVAIPVA